MARRLGPLVVAAALAVLTACNGETAPTTTPTTLPATVTTVARLATTSTTSPAVETSAPVQDPTDTGSDPPIEISSYEEDWSHLEVPEALGIWLDSHALVTGTVTSLERCCENPPIELADVELVDGDFDALSEQGLHSQAFQQLVDRVEIGQHITLLMWFDTAQLVFDGDGYLVHALPQPMADALTLVMEREGTTNHLEAITRMWERYNSGAWRDGQWAAEVYLQGEPAFPDMRCSASGGFGIEPPAIDVPESVNATRIALVEAATSCNFDDIVAMTGATTPLEFWWGMAATPDDLEIEDRDGALRQLVFMLQATEPAAVTADNREGDARTYYVWPAASEADHWQDLDDQDLRTVAIMNNMTVEEFTAAWDLFGGYGWFRVGIEEDGTWIFAVGGH